MGHTVTRYHDISCGHRVHGHESKCAHLHGHNYRIHFMCAPDDSPPPAQRSFFGAPQLEPRGPLDDIGRVVDFSVIKTTLCQWLEDNWDHKMLLWDQDPLCEILDTYVPGDVVEVPFNPTAEHMAEYIVKELAPRLLAGTGARLVACRIDETRKCSASFSLGGAA